jgi:hypothetical protein
MPGYPVSRNEIDQQFGRAVTDLRDALARCSALNDQLTGDTLTAAVLGALDQPYTAGEITLIQASFGDLAGLFRIAHGQQQQVGNNDFFFSARHLTGVR